MNLCARSLISNSIFCPDFKDCSSCKLSGAEDNWSLGIQILNISAAVLPCRCLQYFTLLVGWQEGHPACKKLSGGCWHGYLSGARCRLAYGPADATSTHSLLHQ